MHKIKLPRICRELGLKIGLKSAYHDSDYACLSRPRKLSSEFIPLNRANI